MQIVIDISEKDYQSMQDGHIPFNMLNVVMNGTPLPKGHGDLIDVNDLLDDIGLEDNGYNRDVNAGEIITLENIDRIPRIIEADNGESEDKEGGGLDETGREDHETDKPV